jgi:Fungal specific transcription factor domain
VGSPPDLSMTAMSTKTPQLVSDQKNLSHCWFPLAMTDAALFHALLCGSALYVDLMTGTTDSIEQSRHMKEAVHLLSTRLQDTGAEISDGTMVAVAHLADFAVDCPHIR